ncbi:hypothetical protein VNO80_15892 [Phaseolus coccineus]|uniref:PB1 domain-containing protein n=1 Tax=Phaseolus coccineus TaxID=3886 RepID=A0AAN9MR28_PHACN
MQYRGPGMKLSILGLDICKDTTMGDEMHKGVSGGQKKRVTIGTERLDELVSAIMQRVDVNDRERPTIMYEDDEGDKIVLATDNDFRTTVLKLHLDFDTRCQSVGYANVFDFFKLGDLNGRMHRFNHRTEHLDELVSAVVQRVDVNDGEGPTIMYEDNEGDKTVLATDNDLSTTVSYASEISGVDTKKSGCQFVGYANVFAFFILGDLNGHMHRFKFHELVSTVMQRVDVKDGECLATMYEDDEGDKIVLATDNDLSTAVKNASEISGVVTTKSRFQYVGYANVFAFFKIGDLNGRLHRFNCRTECLDELFFVVMQRVDVNDGECPTIMYEDDEGDKIVLAIDNDLGMAVTCARSTKVKATIQKTNVISATSNTFASAVAMLSEFQIWYEDDEGDKIVLATDNDLGTAVSCARSAGVKGKISASTSFFITISICF